MPLFFNSGAGVIFCCILVILLNFPAYAQNAVFTFDESFNVCFKKLSASCRFSSKCASFNDTSPIFICFKCSYGPHLLTAAEIFLCAVPLVFFGCNFIRKTCTWSKYVPSGGCFYDDKGAILEAPLILMVAALL